MTPQQIDLVPNSWALVVPLQTEVAALFYGRLFHLDPSLRPLFQQTLDDLGY